jgi:hypothetical protein
MLLRKLLGITHMIRYENNASQLKLFVLELEPSFLIKKLPFSPAQYTNARPFSTLLTGQLHEVLQCLTGQGQSAPSTNYSSTNAY